MATLEVRHVRAGDGRCVLRTARVREVTRVGVPAALRPPILRAYPRRAAGGRPHIPVSRDAPLSEFERVKGDYPVFEVRVSCNLRGPGTPDVPPGAGAFDTTGSRLSERGA